MRRRRYGKRVRRSRRAVSASPPLPSASVATRASPVAKDSPRACTSPTTKRAGATTRPSTSTHSSAASPYPRGRCRLTRRHASHSPRADGRARCDRQLPADRRRRSPSRGWRSGRVTPTRRLASAVPDRRPFPDHGAATLSAISATVSPRPRPVWRPAARPLGPTRDADRAPVAQRTCRDRRKGRRSSGSGRRAGGLTHRARPCRAPPGVAVPLDEEGAGVR
jgi:hypothetical protein